VWSHISLVNESVSKDPNLFIFKDRNYIVDNGERKYLILQNVPIIISSVIPLHCILNITLNGNAEVPDR
jgi:hypothetical protein